MAWATNWLVLPPAQVEDVVSAPGDLEDLCRDSLSFPDGDIEADDLNRLWSILQGRADGAGHICEEVLRDLGPGFAKLGRVSAACVRALAGLTDDDIQGAAAAWQQTGVLRYGTVDGAAKVIRALQRLSRCAIRDGDVVLLEGWF